LGGNDGARPDAVQLFRILRLCARLGQAAARTKEAQP
jgi:hypothetical protein